MSLRNRIIWVVTFSVAMGFLEAAVVVYLRELYYPTGFAFPLVVLDPPIGLVEIGREAATVIMLAALGMLAGTNVRERLAFFLMSFAVWDLFYYVFLKLTLDWPTAWLEWDILFLIPAPWVGPVLSPVIVCATMLVLATHLLHQKNTHRPYPFTWPQASLILAGSLTLILSWIWDYLISGGGLGASPEQALQLLGSYIPARFNWWLFAMGEALILGAMALPYLRFNANKGMVPW